MKTVVTILILLVAGVATAQPIVLTQMPADGTYVLTVTGGAVTLQKATVLQIGGPPTDPDVPTPPPTDPTSLATLTVISRGQYEKIPSSDLKPILGATVATVYRSIAAGLRDGSINVAKASEQVGQIRAALPVDWNLWKAETAKTWNELQDKGLITSPATWAAGLDALAAGIASQAEVEEMQIGEPLFGNIAIGELMDILMKLIGGGGGEGIGKWLPIILLILKIVLGGL